MARRISLLIVAAVAALALVAGPAAAAHEANNRFDMAATTAALPDADAVGISNFSAGSNRWNNQVRVSGLTPSTAYDWRGIGGGQNVVICTVVTDGTGAGMCRSDVDSFLGSTELRDAATGDLVARATASTDDNNTVEDGEIERRGTQRF
jgi:hypothetical protein